MYTTMRTQDDQILSLKVALNSLLVDACAYSDYMQKLAAEIERSLFYRSFDAMLWNKEGNRICCQFTPAEVETMQQQLNDAIAAGDERRLEATIAEIKDKIEQLTSGQ